MKIDLHNKGYSLINRYSQKFGFLSQMKDKIDLAERLKSEQDPSNFINKLTPDQKKYVDFIFDSIFNKSTKEQIDRFYLFLILKRMKSESPVKIFYNCFGTDHPFHLESESEIVAAYQKQREGVMGALSGLFSDNSQKINETSSKNNEEKVSQVVDPTVYL